jgi:hypothetical protein
MATPFITTLRRNQGYVLAIMGVVLIITWVIGPAALDFFSGGKNGGRPPQPIVVQWRKAGTLEPLTEGDMVHLRQEHMAVLDYVNRVVKTAVDKGFTPQAPGLNLTPNQRTGGISLGLPMDTSEATVFNILLFAERGRELGVRVDKNAMIAYLRNLSGFSMEEGDFLELAQEQMKDGAKSGNAVSVDGLFAALRKELTAQQAQYMFAASVSNVSTGELWDLHKQLNLRYKIEAYPIDVMKLTSNFKAADAKPDDLMTLFNKGKDRVPNPDLPEPGFKIPHKIAFGYCTVDYEVFMAIAKKNVPEAKAVERYEKGIAQGEFRKPKPLPVPGTEKPKETTPEPKPGETKPSEEKPAGEEKKPAEPEKKEEPKPGESKPAEEKPAAEKPAEKPAEKGAEPAAEKPAGLAIKCEDEPAKEAKPGEAKSEEEKVPAKEEPKSEPAKTEPAKTEPAKEDPAKTDPKKTPDAEKPVGEKTEEPAKEEPKEVIEHQKYEDVRDDILRELAQPEAKQLRDDAVQQAMDELRVYSTNLKRYEESKKEKTEVAVEKPGEFHPQAFANKYKFAYGKTNLADRHEVANTELGKNAVLQTPQGSLTFSQFAYFQSANLYDSQEASSFGETKYLYWRIDDQPEQEVQLEDGKLPAAVKVQVEQAWLKEQAFEAAKKQAKELADKIKGTTLRELVGKKEEGKIVQPIPFSMFTSNGVPLVFGGQPEFSQPNGIPMAGKEFMETVFALKPGEAGVAADQPHNIVYAIHVLTEEPTLEIRREMFLNALQRGQFSDLMGFAAIEKRADIQALFDDLEKHFSVKWIRPPNFGRGGGDE